MGAVTVAGASAGAGAGACAARMASAGAQFRGGQQWAAAYAPQPCRYPPPQSHQYAAAASPYTPHQVITAFLYEELIGRDDDAE